MINPSAIVHIKDHALTSSSSASHVKSAFKGGFGPAQKHIDDESFVKYGELTKSRKRTETVFARSNIQPLLAKKEKNVQAPVHLVEEENYAMWTRGGFPSRSVKVVSKTNIPFPVAECG
jgi:hypothetical protein